MNTYTAKRSTTLAGPGNSTITVKKGEVVYLSSEIADAAPQIWEVTDGDQRRKAR